MERHKVARMIMQDTTMVSYFFFIIPNDNRDALVRTLLNGTIWDKILTLNNLLKNSFYVISISNGYHLDNITCDHISLWSKDIM